MTQKWFALGEYTSQKDSAENPISPWNTVLNLPLNP